jgi:hypothetical protein
MTGPVHLKSLALPSQRSEKKFGKWVQRPCREDLGHEAPPTFVWVLENPDNCMNAHWMVHVPAAREDAFAAMLDKWLEAATGGVHSAKAIHNQIGVHRSRRSRSTCSRACTHRSAVNTESTIQTKAGS